MEMTAARALFELVKSYVKGLQSPPSCKDLTGLLASEKRYLDVAFSFMTVTNLGRGAPPAPICRLKMK